MPGLRLHAISYRTQIRIREDEEEILLPTNQLLTRTTSGEILKVSANFEDESEDEDDVDEGKSIFGDYPPSYCLFWDFSWTETGSLFHSFPAPIMSSFLPCVNVSLSDAA